MCLYMANFDVLGQSPVFQAPAANYESLSNHNVIHFWITIKNLKSQDFSSASV